MAFDYRSGLSGVEKRLDHGVQDKENLAEKKRLILGFCETAEARLNELVSGKSSGYEEFEYNYARPLRFLARAINDQKKVEGEDIPDDNEISATLRNFLTYRNDLTMYPLVDATEIALAINHVAGRLHEVKG